MGVLGINCAGDIVLGMLPRAFAVAIPKGLRNWKIEVLIAAQSCGVARNPIRSVNPRHWHKDKARGDRSRPTQVAAAWVAQGGCDGVWGKSHADASFNELSAQAEMGIEPEVSRSIRAAKSRVGRFTPVKIRWKLPLSYPRRRAISDFGIAAAFNQLSRRSFAFIFEVV